MNDKSKHYPYNKIIWDFNLDGQSSYYRIKGKDKIRFKKQRRKQFNNPKTWLQDEY